MTVKAYREQTMETFYVTRGGRYKQKVAEIRIYYYSKKHVNVHANSVGPNADRVIKLGTYAGALQEALEWVAMYTDPDP